MTKSRHVQAAIAVSLLSLGVLVAGCSSSSAEVVALSSAEYYAQVAQLNDATERDFEDIDRFAEEVRGLDEATIAGLGIRLAAETFARFADGMELLHPPSALAGLHAEAVVGASQIKSTFVKVVERIELEAPAGTSDEVFIEAFEGYDVTTMFDRYNAACLKIEGAAALEQVQLDLNCD